MRGAFDPELYLRLACERQVLDPGEWHGRGPWLSVPIETAMALVAIDAIEPGVAQEILDDYAIALAIRNGSHMPRAFLFRPSQMNRPGRRDLHASRVIACEQDLEQPWGALTIHYVSLGETTTSVAITARESSPGLLISSLGHQGTQQTPITDDQGHTEIANFSGGTGSGGGYHGTLTTTQPLSKTTKWIDINSGRLELPDGVTAPSVYIETTTEGDAATRHLWRLVANPNWSRPPPSPLVGGIRRNMGYELPRAVDTTIETLTAAGALAADAKVIEDARRVMAAWAGQTSPGLPEPWASLIANRGRLRGPSGVVALGAVTPPVDGTVIAVDALVSSRETFDLRVSASPDLLQGGTARFVLDGSAIMWWAEDDRRNHYLGTIGDWGSDGSVGTGTVVYTPPLDPAATELRILPTGSTERAVITVALPDWGLR
ncbi:MAG: hypothetical protein WAM97_17695 [Acidimicrobiales bacterium]